MKACATSFALFNVRLLAFSFFVAGLALSSRPAKVDFSTELRLQTTLFGDYGLYEQNRASTDGSEFEHEFRADFSAKKDDLYLLQLRAGRRLIDAEEFLRPPEEDVLRLHQAYLDLSLPGSRELNLRLGRQVLDYQRGILVGPDDWDLEGNSFDAALLQLDGSTWDLDLLHGHLAKDHHNQVSLISLERTTPRRTINEFYLLRFGLDAEEDTLPLGAHPDIEVYNLGARMEGKLSRPLFYHWMINYQTGAMKMNPEKDMRSYNFVANLDYFVDHPLLRNVGIEYSYSSGDDASTPNRHETFLPPFADRHVRSGTMDWMSMMNGETSPSTSSPTLTPTSNSSSNTTTSASPRRIPPGMSRTSPPPGPGPATTGPEPPTQARTWAPNWTST